MASITKGGTVAHASNTARGTATGVAAEKVRTKPGRYPDDDDGHRQELS